MNLESAGSYADRMERVLRYIDVHLDEDLDLDRLSAVASFSKHHFHRLFRHRLGIGTFRYVQLRRLKRAVHELAFRSDRPVLDIALASGYEGPEAFARAFRKTLRQSPSEFRRKPDWYSWFEAYDPLTRLRGEHMKGRFTSSQVRIVDFPPTRVAALEHRGDPRLVGETVRRFVQWRKLHGLSPAVSATFNIFHTDPETDPEAFRLDICASTDQQIVPNIEGVVARTIPGGRCAAMRHIGGEESLEEAIRYLYAEWLPASAQELRDYPLFLQRLKFFPDVPEHEAVQDVFLPLA